MSYLDVNELKYWLCDRFISRVKEKTWYRFNMKKLSKHQIARADLVFRGRMAKTPFLEHDAFSYSFESGGYKNYTFGAVTGPTFAISNIFHEMAHAIDFVLSGDDLESRTKGGRFWFNTNEIEINGRLYEQVNTTQCTERECRAFAIQIKFMHMVGFKTNLNCFAQYSAKLTTWLPDFYLIHGDNEAERIQWAKNHIIDLYNNLSEDEIFKAFQTYLDSIFSFKTIKLSA